jgi:hypothetical protein
MTIDHRDRRNGKGAELKLRIMKQQQLAAKLYRQGKKEEARAARNKLIVLLNLDDIHSAFHSEVRKTA